MNIKTLAESAALIVLGMLLVFTGIAYRNPDPNAQPLMISIGYSIAALGTGFFCFELAPVYLHLPKRKKATSGSVFIWVISLAAICIYSIAYFALLWPTLQVINVVESSFTFDTSAQSVINLAKMVLTWHPIFFIVGWIIAAFVHTIGERERVYQPGYY